MIGAGTTDVGAGTKINATEFSLPGSGVGRRLLRSPGDISADLPAGNRFYSTDLGGGEAQTFLIKTFTCGEEG